MARRNIDLHPKDEYKTKQNKPKQKRKKEKEKKRRKKKKGGSPKLENTAPVRHMSD